MFDFTTAQTDRAREYAVNIIENLPPKAVDVLLSGYNNDLDKLTRSIFSETNKVLQLNATIDSEKIEYLVDLEIAMDARLKKLSYNYFKTTVLSDFISQMPRNLEWGNMVQLYPWSSYEAARAHGKSYEFAATFPMWRLYSFDPPSAYQKGVDIDNKNRKETCLITNTYTQGEMHALKIVEEIKNNPILAAKLNPNNRGSIGTSKIITETGSMLHRRAKDSQDIRGLHVGAVLVDDFLDDSVMYSLEQSNKFEETFYSNIIPIVEPFGYLLVSGTPYTKKDLYAKLKTDQQFKCFEYPAIFPDGSLLSPDRFTFEQLMAIKRSLGTIRFTREYLCSPLSDDATLFPWEYLNKAFIGMENVVFAENIQDYPFKMVRVAIGADFAKSANIGADNSAFTVWGKDSSGHYHLIYYWRKRGASFVEQVNQLISMNQRFNPNKIICESNGFQSIFADELRSRGLRNVETFTTTSKVKKDWGEGLPSMSAMFERGEIKIPYRVDGGSREKAEIVCSEFNSITVLPDKGKIESVGEHDDLVMSSFFAVNDLREKGNNEFKAYTI